jgi:RNA polymerase sigma-70 factor, ECF subfamily
LFYLFVFELISRQTMKEEQKNIEKAYRKYSKPIYRHIFYRISDKDLAEDLLHETFFKTWQYIISEKREVKDMKNFLYKVAKNLIIDHYRQREKAPYSIEDDFVKNIPVRAKQQDETDNKIRLDAFKKQLSKLEGEQKKLIEYRYFGQLSIEEICERTDKSPNHISVIIHQGIKIIKKNIGEDQ